MTGSGNGLVVVGRDQVLDRRLGERRGRRDGQGLGEERRKSDRRRTAGARGFLIAHRDPHAGARDWGTLR